MKVKIPHFETQIEWNYLSENNLYSSELAW